MYLLSSHGHQIQVQIQVCDVSRYRRVWFEEPVPTTMTPTPTITYSQITLHVIKRTLSTYQQIRDYVWVPNYLRNCIRQHR